MQQRLTPSTQTLTRHRRLCDPQAYDSNSYWWYTIHTEHRYNDWCTTKNKAVTWSAQAEDLTNWHDRHVHRNVNDKNQTKRKSTHYNTHALAAWLQKPVSQ